jgi:hypothetical protein
MSGPFVVVVKSRVKPGMSGAYDVWLETFCRLVDEREPRILGFHTYGDQKGELSTVVQVHPDAESMEFHFHAMGDQLEEMHQYLDGVESIELLGSPTDRVLKGLSQSQDVLDVSPVYVAGVSRLA